MARTQPTILTGWWDFAVQAFGLLTNPRTDVAQNDRQVEALARDSIVGASLDTMSLAIRRAWSASSTKTRIASITAAAVPSAAVTRWRAYGWISAVAGATALVLMPLSTISAGPLVWITPALFVVGGLLVMMAASPLSRAAADRRRRSSSPTQ